MKKLLILSILLLAACSKEGLVTPKSEPPSDSPPNPLAPLLTENTESVTVPLPDDCYSIPGNSVPKYAKLVASDKVVVAHTGCGLALSKDHGASFTQIKDLGFGPLYAKSNGEYSKDVNFVGTVALQGETLYASQDKRIKGDSQLGAIVKSTDFGTSWTKLGELRGIQEMRLTDFHLFAINDWNGFLYPFRLDTGTSLEAIAYVGCHWSRGPFCRAVSKTAESVAVERIEVPFSSNAYKVAGHGSHIYTAIEGLKNGLLFVSSDNGKTFAKVTSIENLSSRLGIFPDNEGAFIINRENLYFLKTDLSVKPIEVDGTPVAVATNAQFVYVLLVKGNSKLGWKFELKIVKKGSI